MAANSSDQEGVRRGLEVSIANIYKLLRHWRTLEAEYEGLREALSGMREGVTQQHLNDEAFDCEGELLTTKEIKGLLEDNGRPRTVKQILGMLSRRIDYVQDNVKATEKRLQAEQEKLDKANYVELRDEGGLPLTEITEVLDEEDNVISTSVSKPAEAAPKILEAMRQSGLTDEKQASGVRSQGTGEKINSSSEINRRVNESETLSRSNSGSNTSKRKSVSFAESHEVIEAPPNPTLPSADTVKGGKEAAIEAHEVDEELPSQPIIPENESPEDAALRREMIRYNMEEVGNVVAEMDLSNLSDGDYDDYDDDDDYDAYEMDDEDEDEDQFGRTTASVISDEYREKMLELERKLNARSVVNVGKGLTDVKDIKTETKGSTNGSQPNGEESTDSERQKSVRFAESLDIQEKSLEKPTAYIKPPASATEEPERPVAADIIERRSPSNAQPSNIQPPKKISKFKAARANGQGPSRSNPNSVDHNGSPVNGPLATKGLSDRLVPAWQTASNKFLSIPLDENKPQNTPAAPRGKTHVEALVERPARDSASAAREPDDFDPALLNQQVMTEYNQVRNRMIQREDGFMSIDREDLEDEDGRPRMSRFKAARLTHSQ